MLKDFKEFAMRGNVVDLAIGVIIGAAFGKIVDSLVNDIVMPPIGLILGNVNFADLFLPLKDQSFPSLSAAKAAGAPVIAYGNFINTIVNFIIIAFVIYLMVRAFNRMQREPKPAPKEPTTKECPYCKTSIPLHATRCPNCTSVLDGSGPQLKQAAPPVR